MKKGYQQADIPKVAPFAGAWIEIKSVQKVCKIFWVAPFAGAWIEMLMNTGYCFLPRSLPSRERGLKFKESSKR